MTRASAVVVELKPTPRNGEEWCARMCSDDVTPADRIALEAWLSASAENRADYELCALVMQVSRDLPRRSSGRKRRWLAAGAAAMVAGAGLVALWLVQPATYATRVGEQKVVALADGSTVELNTASSIAVDLEKTERHVVLRQGEAFFSVAPNRNRPFIVEAGDSIVRVVGTKFNVRVDGNNTSVTVVQGHVEVTKPRRTVAEPPAPPTELVAGEGARIAPEEPVAKLPIADARRYTSWREGKIEFENDPLSKVIEEVNRYSEQQFVIADDVRALTLSGVFRTGDTKSVLFALRESYGLQSRTEDGRIYITAPKR